MVLANRTRAPVIAAVATLSSVAGGLMGYGIGAWAFETVGRIVLHFSGIELNIDAFRAMYGHWGMLIVFVAGLTPLPYKVFTIASGVAALDPATFLLASLLSRGIRFFGEALLLRRFGEPVYLFVEKNLWVFSAWFLFAVAGGLVAAHFMFSR